MAVGCHGNCISCLVAPQAADGCEFRTKLQSVWWVFGSSCKQRQLHCDFALGLKDLTSLNLTHLKVSFLFYLFYSIHYASPQCSCGSKLALKKESRTESKCWFIRGACLLSLYAVICNQDASVCFFCVVSHINSYYWLLLCHHVGVQGLRLIAQFKDINLESHQIEVWLSVLTRDDMHGSLFFIGVKNNAPLELHWEALAVTSEIN